MITQPTDTPRSRAQRALASLCHALLLPVLLSLGGCGGSGAPVEPDAPDSITRRLVVVSFVGDRDEALAGLAAAVGISEEEAASLLDALPADVAVGLSAEDADALAGRLTAAGLTTRTYKER